jgi:hypothetical protein
MATTEIVAAAEAVRSKVTADTAGITPVVSSAATENPTISGYQSVAEGRFLSRVAVSSLRRADSRSHIGIFDGIHIRIVVF